MHVFCKKQQQQNPLRLKNLKLEHLHNTKRVEIIIIKENKTILPSWVKIDFGSEYCPNPLSL